MSAGERYGLSAHLTEPLCSLCNGWGGWYVTDHAYDYGLEPTPPEWHRCLKCGGSGDETKPKMPVSVARE